MQLIHGDCLEKMKDIPDHSVDLILTDPPYGTTACKWDTIIPFNDYVVQKVGRKMIKMDRDAYVLYNARRTNKSVAYLDSVFQENCDRGMWHYLNKIIKPNGAIVLFGSEPFSSSLRMSNIKNYKYDWVWVKNMVSGVAQAKNKPITCYENIMVFSDGVTVHACQTKKRMPYNPQGLIPIHKVLKNTKHTHIKAGGIGQRPSHKEEYVQEQTNYPRNVLAFDCERGLHPTQKPVALMEYLTKTYTNEGETVLDFTMGSGSTGIACINTKRNFIGIEKDDKYFEIAKKRIEEHLTAAST